MPCINHENQQQNPKSPAHDLVRMHEKQINVKGHSFRDLLDDAIAAYGPEQEQ